MQRPQHAPPATPPTIKMSEGWHCLHLYLRVNQKEWQGLADYQRAEGREQNQAARHPQAGGDRPEIVLREKVFDHVHVLLASSRFL